MPASALHSAASSKNIGIDLRSGQEKIEPLPHYTNPVAIAPDAYRELAASFPDINFFTEGRRDWISNQAIRRPASMVLADRSVPAIWREFFEYHTSQAFWAELVARFGPEIRRRHPWLEEKVGRPLEEWRVKVRNTEGEADVTLDVLFVINTPVTKPCSVKPPHVDARSKIFTGLLYMREPADPTPGGELELYGSREDGFRFDKTYVLPATARLARRIPYAPNYFLGFVNSADAVHGVSPRPVTDRLRRYVDFGAELPFQVFDLPQASLPSRLWHRLTQPRGRAYTRPAGA